MLSSTIKVSPKSKKTARIKAKGSPTRLYAKTNTYSFKTTAVSATFVRSSEEIYR